MRDVKIGDNVRTNFFGEGVVTAVIDPPGIHGYDTHVKLPQYRTDLAFKRSELTRIPKHRGDYNPKHWGEKKPEVYDAMNKFDEVARYRKPGPAN